MSEVGDDDEVCFCSGLFIVTDQQQIYDEWWHSNKVFDRLLINMRTYAEETNVRYARMTPMRANYEKSAHFEMGYLMSEILERYRKMVHSLKGPADPKARHNSLFITIKRLEFVQKLFLEIYHLVNMMHEINRKYKNLLLQESAIMGGETDLTEVNRALEQIEYNRKLQAKKRKKQMQKMQRQKKYGYIEINFPSPKGNNKWWPLDYGWEIDYYWR
ncbi:unnamed protein product [Colias eurytheme]|nr:unnamed protein product [Colias eurytheme]